MLALLLWAVLLPPADAARVVVALEDRPQDLRTLLAIGRRESALTRVGVHRRDRWSTRHAWARAVRAGYIDPSNCPFHRRDVGWWGTRGAFGHVAAFAAQYLPCLPPEVLDIPVVSAWVSLRRLDVARRRGAPRALRAWAMLALRAVTARQDRRALPVGEHAETRK